MTDAKGSRDMATDLARLSDDPDAVLSASPDPQTFVLIALDRARAWLVTAKNVEDLKTLAGQAELMHVYARQVDLGREAENAACEIRIRAERRVGELLLERPPPTGRPKTVGERDRFPALRDHGLTKDESSSYQRLAAMSERDFEERIELGKETARLSRAQVLHAPQPVSVLDPARQHYEEVLAEITPEGYDPTFDNEAMADFGAVITISEHALELADRRPPGEFAERYRTHRLASVVGPKLIRARDYLTALIDDLGLAA